MIQGEIVIDRPVEVNSTMALTRATSRSTTPAWSAQKDHARPGREGNPVPFGRSINGAHR
jgi:hypothetical protein